MGIITPVLPLRKFRLRRPNLLIELIAGSQPRVYCSSLCCTLFLAYFSLPRLSVSSILLTASECFDFCFCYGLFSHLSYVRPQITRPCIYDCFWIQNLIILSVRGAKWGQMPLRNSLEEHYIVVSNHNLPIRGGVFEIWPFLFFH